MATKRKRMFMLVQYLNPKYYNWTAKNYSDEEIIKNASKYSSKDYSNKKNKYHYLYTIYNKYYWPIIHNWQHPFNDYGFIFYKDNPKKEARRVQAHIIIRLNYFYFRDTLHNEKHTKGKKGQTNVVPPIIASKLHNRDMKDSLDANKKITKVTIPPHLHFVIKFNKQRTPNQLSKWCGVAPQYFESGSTGRYAFENAMAYLCHAKQPNKHVYDFRDVWSNKPVFDYQQYYAQHARKWEEYRATDIDKRHQISVDWLAQRVQHGDLTKQDILKNTQYRYVYADNMQKINNAVLFHQELVGELTLMALREHKYSLSVFYIWGAPGSGKTYMALNLARRIAKKYHWSIYQGASQNTFDDYSGEQIALLDDIRSTTMTASDWLKLLDPINISPNSSRYHNKTVSARVIIMTNPEPPAQFFGYMRNVHGNEPLSQFIRRLTEIAHVINAKSHHKVLLSNVRKLSKPYPIKIGEHYSSSGDNDHAITRRTRYVSHPNQNMSNDIMAPAMVSEKGAINILMNVTRKQNDPKIKHMYKDKDMISLENYLGNSVVKQLNLNKNKSRKSAYQDWVKTGHNPKDFPL